MTKYLLDTQNTWGENVSHEAQCTICILSHVVGLHRTLLFPKDGRHGYFLFAWLDKPNVHCSVRVKKVE